MMLPVNLRLLPLLLVLGPAGLPALAQNPIAAPAPTAAGRALFAGSLVPKLVARQFAFTEGPAVDKAGNIFFTDQPNDKIWKYDTSGKLSVFMSPTGRANGLYFDKQGNLLACADGPNQLWAIAPTTKQVTVLARRPTASPYNGPNDVWVNGKTEGIYFTDPYYQREYWAANHPGPGPQYVYYLAPGGAAPVPLDSTLQKPNGLIGTPDGRLLYVADIEAGKTYRYRLGRQGEVLDREVFVEQGSDGLTLDEQGNVYLTGKGVTIYNPAGQQIAHLDVPGAWTANLCFGGKDLKTLFITASEAVYTVPMRVRGIR